jgi:hypothetical protein
MPFQNLQLLTLNPSEIIEMLLNDYGESEINTFDIGLLFDVLLNSDITFEEFNKIDFEKILMILEVYKKMIEVIDLISNPDNLTPFENAFLDMLTDHIETYENCAHMFLTYQKICENRVSITNFIFPTETAL